MAGPTLLDGAVPEGGTVERSFAVRVERLRVRHFGGPVEIVATTESELRIEVTDVRNLPSKPRGLFSRQPAVRVTLEEVSPGNFLLALVAPEGSESGPTSAPEGFFSAAEGVVFGDGVRINVGESDVPAVSPTASEATVRVFVPATVLRHLSATTGFGAVTVTGIHFPEPPAGERPTNVVHAATNAGKVRLSNVRNAVFFAPTSNFSTKDECKLGIVTAFQEASIEAYFR
jgi:hypothetical protein